MNNTPLGVIRKYCLWDTCSSNKEIELCPNNKCALHKIRFGKGGKRNLQSIKLKCLDCSSDSIDQVKNCKHTDCPLFFYRLGKNPKLKGKKMSKQSLSNLIFRKKSDVII